MDYFNAAFSNRDLSDCAYVSMLTASCNIDVLKSFVKSIIQQYTTNSVAAASTSSITSGFANRSKVFFVVYNNYLFLSKKIRFEYLHILLSSSFKVQSKALFDFRILSFFIQKIVSVSK